MTEEEDGGLWSLPQLIEEKERELSEMHLLRVRSLESTVARLTSALETQKSRFSQVKRDFHYNLSLLEDRDKELSRYDQAFSQLKTLIADKEEQLSEMHERVVELEERVEIEKQEAKEKEKLAEERLKDLRAKWETDKWAVEELMRKERKAFQVHKEELESKLVEREEQLDRQREELEATFDQVNEKRRAEWVAERNDLRHQVEALKRENDKLQSQLNKANLEKTRLAESLEAQEKECKGLQWELEDVRKLKDARIEELAKTNDDLVLTKQRILDEYEDKMTELLSSLHSVERAFVQQKEQYETRLQSMTQSKDVEALRRSENLEARLLRLAQKLEETEEQLEASRNDFSKAKWEYEEQLSSRQRRIDELQDEVHELCSSQKGRTKHLERQLEDTNKQLESAKATVSSLESKLAEKSDLATRAQQSVNELTERLNSLQVEFSQKVSELEHARESGVRDLRKERDSLALKAKHQESTIQDLQNTVTELRSQVQTVQAELHSALQSTALNDKLFEGDTGPPSPIGSWKSGSTAPPVKQQQDLVEELDTAKYTIGLLTREKEELGTVVKRLQTEKENLSTALRTMRAEMEQLSHVMSQDQQDQAGREKENEEKDLNESRHSLHDKQQQSDQMVQVSPRNVQGRYTASVSSLVEENRLLYSQSDKLNNYIKLLRESQNVPPTRELAVLREILDNQADQIKLLKRNEVALLEELETMQSDTNNVGHALGRQEIRELQDKLSRVTEERDQLADLSNKLRTEISRASSSSISADQIRHIEKQVADTFQTKIKSVEQALEQIIAQNRTLKQQLRVAQQQAPKHEQAEQRPSHPHRSEQEQIRETLEKTPPPQPPPQSDLVMLGIQGTQAAIPVATTESSRASARARLEEARRKLEQSNTKASSSAVSATTNTQQPSAQPKASTGQVTIGRHKIRNYAVKD